MQHHASMSHSHMSQTVTCQSQLSPFPTHSFFRVFMKRGFTGQSEDLEELRARFTVRNAAVGGVVAVALPVAIYVDVRYLCNGRVWCNVAQQNARSARQIACGSLGNNRACSVPFNLWEASDISQCKNETAESTLTVLLWHRLQRVPRLRCEASMQPSR